MKNYEVGPAAVAVIRMPCVSLAIIPAAEAPGPTEAPMIVAAMVADAALLAELEPPVEFLMLDKVRAVKLDPSLTARIDGVEMDFCSVKMRGDSHLDGSPSRPPPPPSLDIPRGFVGSAGINWMKFFKLTIK